MGFGQAFMTLGGTVTGFGEVYVGLFWALVFGSLALTAWHRLKKRPTEREEGRVQAGDPPR